MKSLEEQVSGSCIHFTGLMNKVCKAGVEYDSFPQPRFKTLPCLKGTALCDKCQFPTPEEVQKELSQIKDGSDKALKLLLAIKKHYKENKTDLGICVCPNCGTKTSYIVAPNGHFAVTCATCKLSLRE